MRDRFSDSAGRADDVRRSARLGLVAQGVCAAALLCAASAASVIVAPGMDGVAGAVLGGVAVAIAVVDYRWLVIPDELNAAALLAGLAAAALTSPAAPFGAILDAALRALAMFAAFLVFRLAYRKIRGVEGMGLGDVKLAAAAGAWLDWPLLPVAVDFAALAALAAVLAARLGGRKLTLTSRLPFGVFFAPSIWLCWAIGAWLDRAA